MGARLRLTENAARMRVERALEKLQGQEIVQLQLSATVAVRCQFGSAARGGAVRVSRAMAVPAKSLRMIGECAVIWSP